MKRVSLIALFVAAVLVLAPSAAPAQAASLISAGIEMHDGSSHAYFYGEVEISPTLVGTFEYAADHPLVLGAWYGAGQGFYGEIELATAGSGQTIEVGVWRGMALSETIEVTGWIGAKSDLEGSAIWAQGGAELAVPLASSITLLAGAETSLLKKETDSSTWVALGLYF